MPFKIAVIDDSIRDKTDVIASLPALLEREGYEVAATADGEVAYDLVCEFKPDLIVLDIHFERQDIDGIEICRAIRLEDDRTPIILITAVFTETDDVLRGFKAGAGDYVRRPCDNLEILARIQAHLPPETRRIDDRLHIDFQNQRAWVDGQSVCLQPLLFRLLAELVRNAGRIMESTRLKDRVWDKDVSDDALAVFIRRLREKLEPDPQHPTYIETIRGVGYRFNSQPAKARHESAQRREP